MMTQVNPFIVLLKLSLSIFLCWCLSIINVQAAPTILGQYPVTLKEKISNIEAIAKLDKNIVKSQSEIIPKGYVESLEDAAQSDLDEVLEHLTVIKNPDSNPNLYWDKNGRILVATLTRKDSFNPQKTISQKEIWVTAVPELKNFCTDYKTANPEVDNQQLNERIEQLLGIRPHSQKTHIAEIWVNPTYLKRPIDDPALANYDKEMILQRIQQSSLPKNLNDEASPVKVL